MPTKKTSKKMAALAYHRWAKTTPRKKRAAIAKMNAARVGMDPAELSKRLAKNASKISPAAALARALKAAATRKANKARKALEHD